MSATLDNARNTGKVADDRQTYLSAGARGIETRLTT